MYVLSDLVDYQEKKNKSIDTAVRNIKKLNYYNYLNNKDYI